ncbi:hypothetical protein NBZ79_03890 [Sneathiella marina]|uniref:Antifreeze glycopeptide n=1 Tax=Sneathiella marina TaxID=2950108 RepID=A0ABY4W4J5_9PROT|nr:hypothetical protein [Sneathiella marina]USG62115.1 hypothetical protein NBZ79_03890 [Sneathiella marina]
MTNSPSKRFFSAFAASFLGLVIGVGVTMAQEKPRSLVPDLNSSKQATGKGLTAPEKPASTTFGSPATGNKAENAAPQSALIVKSLGGLDVASVGTLDTSTGGLGPGMWTGTAPDRVVTLLTYLPVSAVSPAMQDLYRRLLLTAAVIPRGVENPTELMALRLSKLQEAGRITDASLLASKISPTVLTDELVTAVVNLQFLQGENEQACRQVKIEKPRTADRFWIKAGIFCDLLDEKIEQAELGAALLEEQGETDTLFLDLFDRLAGGDAVMSEADLLFSPLHYAMIRHAGMTVSFEDAENSGYDIVWALATQENAQKDQRLRASYQSLAVGSLGPELSRQLILDKALDLPAEDEGDDAVAKIAELYRLIANEKDKEALAEPLSSLWATGFQDGSYLAATQLSAPLLAEIPAASQSDKFEIDAVRLLLAGGDAASAGIWERVARRAALRGTPEERLSARKRIDRVDAYMLISGAPGIARWNPATFDATSFVQGEDLARGENVGLLLAILGVFDQEIPENLWSEALDLGQVTQPRYSNLVIEKNLDRAAEAGRVGETIALSLTALGKNGPSSVSLTTLSRVLTSLKKVGLEKEARALALEAAILRDL